MIFFLLSLLNLKNCEIHSNHKFPTRTQQKPQQKSSHHSRQTAPLIPRTSTVPDHTNAAQKLANAKCHAKALQLTNLSSAKKSPAALTMSGRLS